ncbi:MAG TPA: 7-cyano-7-deazaguanine synthase QueC [Casimicrobiaceae bacterium]|nr:7-cyano-7-deazaguanine synthase QueC [Casimicrobiaceae bacterium]
MKPLVLFSGGADSATLLLLLRSDSPLALSFDYGQKHRVELDYARRFARHHAIEHRVLPLPGAIFGASALLGDMPMPEGHYTEATMRDTVVPNRNMVMLALGASFALRLGRDTVAYAAHADDHGTYPDCRPAFIAAMREAFALCHYEPLRLLTPFSHLGKRDIVKIGRELGIDYSMTWSCYAGGSEPCGRCGACSARREAMA